VSDAVLIAVEDDPEAMLDLERELCERYGNHYQVECIRSPDDARTRMQELADANEDVAVVLAAQSLAGITGSELLDESRRLHPNARRVLLIGWGDWGVSAIGEAIFDSIASGRIDHYLLRPTSPPDELFHHAISGLLLDWAETQRTSPHTVYVVGESWSGRAYELREALGRCAMPHSFHLADSQSGQAIVQQAGTDAKLPLVVFPNGKILHDPTNAELAQATGSPVHPESMDFDLVIVGGGPAGLSAAVYGASEGFSTLVVDEGGVGGQATSSSLIRNYLGFPRGVSGRRLAQDAYQQAWVFGAKFAFMQRVTNIRRDGGELGVELSDSGLVRARAVLLATGASYRRLGVPALEALNGAGVFYGGPASEASRIAGRDVYILGGANSAGQAALYLSRFARHVTLVVRGESIADGMSHYLVRQIEATENLEVQPRTEVVGGGGNGRLEHLVLRDRGDSAERTVSADALFLMIGATPHTEWLPAEIERDENGFVLTGSDVRADSWPLERSPFLFETSLPGVFAAGDIRHGSVKRVAAAVGEGSVAIQLLHQLFAADELHPRGRPHETASAAY
jgi:thioredoxin reductase (NADPH)